MGKTAIAEGIAERIAKGQVPIGLRDKEIFLLDLTSLVAGTQFRGQFEQRVKGLLSEVKAAGNVILFIDEIHTITSAGESEGAMNAGNILKPALSRGEIQSSVPPPLPSTASTLKKIRRWNAVSSLCGWKSPA